MRLHENEEDFRDLCSITAGYIGIPEDAVRRDYYIVSMLQKLEKSEFAEGRAAGKSEGIQIGAEHEQRLTKGC